MTTGRVVVVGSVNFDTVLTVERLPNPGETLTARSTRTGGGGKGANAALASAAVAPTSLVACVGRDHEPATADLRAAGVDLQLDITNDAPTGRAVVLVDAAAENIVIVDPGANAHLSRDAVQRRLPDDAAVVLTNFEIGDDAVLAAAEAAHERGATLVLNPAPVRDLPAALYGLGPLLTPNADEARRLAGINDLDRAAEILAGRTGAPVIITCGADGALVLDGHLSRVAAPHVDAVDTTGAGDAFNGTLAGELAAGRPLAEAVERAVRAASETTRYAGARQPASAASTSGRSSSGVTVDS